MFVALTMIISVGVGVLLGVIFGGRVGLGPAVGVKVTVGVAVGERGSDGAMVSVGVGVRLGISVGCGEEEHVADFSSFVIPHSFLAITPQVYDLPDSGVCVTVILSVPELAGISPSFTNVPSLSLIL